MIQIRTATLQNAKAIAGIAHAYRREPDEEYPTLSQLEASIIFLMTSNDAEFYIAIQDEQVVGYALQRFRYAMWSCGVEANIEDVCTDPTYIESGISVKLIDFALHAAKERGCISTWTCPPWL